MTFFGTPNVASLLSNAESFRQGTTLPLKRWLAGHHVETAWQRGWSELFNANLLAATEAAGFILLITTNHNLRHQLDLSRCNRGVVLTVANEPNLEPFASENAAVLEKIGPRECVEWSPP